MRFHEITSESLDRPLPYTWVEQTERTHLATFEIEDVGYWVKMYETSARIRPSQGVERMWVINFGIDPQTSKKLHGHPHAIMKPTGLNRHPHRVISTVLAAIDDFMSHVRPPMVWFSDTDHLKQRERLYQKFARHLITKFSYHFDEPIMRQFAGEPIWCLRSADHTVS